MVCRTLGKFLPSWAFHFLIRKLDFGISAIFSRTMEAQVWPILTHSPGEADGGSYQEARGRQTWVPIENVATAWLCDLGEFSVSF